MDNGIYGWSWNNTIKIWRFRVIRNSDFRHLPIYIGGGCGIRRKTLNNRVRVELLEFLSYTNWEIINIFLFLPINILWAQFCSLQNLEHEIHNDAANTGTLNEKCISLTNSLTPTPIYIYRGDIVSIFMTKFTNICIQVIYKNPINYALNFNLLSNVILLKKIK
jgi:hypothetical protein